VKEMGFNICALSNGNLSLLQNMATHANLPWTRVFSAERFGAYKPHPSVYTGACKELGLEAGECAMVAAHLGDPQAARECGLKTIYIERPDEESCSVDKVREARRRGWVNDWIETDERITVGGILEVARKFETVTMV